ncbi:hypothetical protein RRG08_060968 [Elysia crispata]|uniref:Uncharacterized protein n=1 Tax=Elysia crispata TaxID=231223 RepID=A0AAE1AUS9_9GAST|nr:hypothetical protein RRG08_060968 [Elysia crispata]
MPVTFTPASSCNLTRAAPPCGKQNPPDFWVPLESSPQGKRFPSQLSAAFSAGLTDQLTAREATGSLKLSWRRVSYLPLSGGKDQRRTPEALRRAS